MIRNVTLLLLKCVASCLSPGLCYIFDQTYPCFAGLPWYTDSTLVNTISMREMVKGIKRSNFVFKCYGKNEFTFLLVAQTLCPQTIPQFSRTKQYTSCCFIYFILFCKILSVTIPQQLPFPVENTITNKKPKRVRITQNVPSFQRVLWQNRRFPLSRDTYS